MLWAVLGLAKITALMFFFGTLFLSNQKLDISNEIEAGIIVGKSNIDVIGSMNRLSNTQIRDFTFNPDLQLAFVNSLEQQQKDKIFNLSFNSVSESSIFDTQVTDISSNSFNSFVGTSNPNFSFFDINIIDEAIIDKEAVTESQFKINNITQVEQPLTRKINLKNRFNKEEETLNYIKTLDDNFKPV